MTLYVDDMLRPARPAGFRGPQTPRWSHLFADSTAELLNAADALGLQARWLQHPGTHREHFDVTAQIRHRAIHALGATQIGYPVGVADLLDARRLICGCRGRVEDCQWAALVAS